MARTRDFTVRVNDGLRIAVEDTRPEGNYDAKPLVCLAGLTRTRRDFYALREYFASHARTPRRVVLMDARGRGTSDYAPAAAHYSPLKEADDVASVCIALGIHHPVIIGTSRGGILAMVLAVLKPSLMAGCVLNDIGPRIALRGLLRLRSQLGSFASPADWEQAKTLVRKAMAHQFPVFNGDDWAHYTRLTFADVHGKPEQQFDPAILDSLAHINSQTTEPNLTAQFRALARRPVLVLRGEHSDLLDEDALKEAQTMGAQALTVPGQGHAPALRGELLNDVADFLRDRNL